LDDDVPCVKKPLDEQNHRRRKRKSVPWRELDCFKQDIDLELREAVMSESQTRFINTERLAVDLGSICSAVAIGAECNEVVILVLLTVFPRDDVVNVNLDVSARWDGAPVARFDKYSPANLSRDCRTPVCHEEALFNAEFVISLRREQPTLGATDRAIRYHPAYRPLYTVNV
jgi:hypothetical protein